MLVRTFHIPMSQQFISITEAAEISQKSIQTIRRAIKSKRIVYRRQKTPQGFNYLINRQSLYDLFKIKTPSQAFQEASSFKEAIKTKEVESNSKSEKIYITSDDFAIFTKTLEKMVSQHSEERQNFLRLINTFQEKIFFLENQVNLLKGPSKKWYQVWK